MKKTVRDVDLKGKKVLMRCDFNVPMENGEITDDARIKGAIPTIEYVAKAGGRIILMSHMGRPKGEPKAEFSLKPVSERLAQLLGQSVIFAGSDVVVDQSVKDQVEALQDGQILMLENTRFRKEETENGEDFTKELASLGEIFVNDAFGTAHRAHSSTEGIGHFMPGVSGFLIEKELDFLGNAVNNPERPFVAIMGGAKVGDKIPVIEEILKKVDTLILGGGMTYTFMKAQGYGIGTSLLDADNIEMAGQFMEKAKAAGVKLMLPVDVLCTDRFGEDGPKEICNIENMPENMMGLDIGPKTIQLYAEEISKAKTIIWNGPMGVFEMDSFAKGTKAVAEAMAASQAITIIGGGDSAAAVNKFGLGDQMTHISTGGGASLEFLEGKQLPGVTVLEDK